MAVADAVADAEAGHTENEAKRHNEQAPVPRQKFALNATIRTHSRTTGRATSHCARHESPWPVLQTIQGRTIQGPTNSRSSYVLFLRRSRDKSGPGEAMRAIGAAPGSSWPLLGVEKLEEQKKKKKN